MPKSFNILESLGKVAERVMPSVYNLILSNKLKKVTGDGKTPYIPTDVSRETDTGSVPLTGEPKQDILPSNTSGDLKAQAPFIPGTDQPVTTEQPGAGSQTGQTDGFYPPKIYVPKQQQEKQTKVPNTQQNFSVLKSILGNDKVDLSNTNLTNNLLDYIQYASKFGQYGQPFVNEALNVLYPLQLKQKPNIPEGQITRDANGNAVRMIYDPTTSNTSFIPLTGPDGKPVPYSMVKPEFQAPQPKLTPVRIPKEDGTAKLGFMDEAGNVVKETEVDWENYNTNPLAYDKLQQQLEMLQMKEQNKNEGKGKGKGSNNAGNEAPFTLMYNGKPVDLQTASALGIGALYKGLYSQSKKIRKQSYDILSRQPGFTFGTGTTTLPTLDPNQNVINTVLENLDQQPEPIKEMWLKKYGKIIFGK